jgi:hypothetical protein
MISSNDCNNDEMKQQINMFYLTVVLNALRSLSLDLYVGAINMYELATYFDSLQEETPRYLTINLCALLY